MTRLGPSEETIRARERVRKAILRQFGGRKLHTLGPGDLVLIIIQYSSATPQKMERESCKTENLSKRKPNWNKKGTQTLVTLAVENGEILFSKYLTSVTFENKKTVWAEITKQ